MKPYSDIPSRRAVQVATDVGIVLWVVLWVRIAQRVYDATMALAAPGRNLAGAGSSSATPCRAPGTASTTCRCSTTGSPRPSGPPPGWAPRSRRPAPTSSRPSNGSRCCCR